jgi:hypothetical protein
MEWMMHPVCNQRVSDFLVRVLYLNFSPKSTAGKRVSQRNRMRHLLAYNKDSGEGAKSCFQT